MLAIDKIWVDVLALGIKDKLQLVDKILTSLHPVNKGVDTTWSEEAEERVTAFKNGNISAVDEEDVFEKYDK